ncbi:MAG: carbohydrate-binding domain-containing protein [Bilifractor sp.]|jgi:hypothetical protein
MNQKKKKKYPGKIAITIAFLALMTGFAGCGMTSQKTDTGVSAGSTSMTSSSASAEDTSAGDDNVNSSASNDTGNSSVSADTVNSSSGEDAASSSANDGAVNSDGTINTENLFSDRDLEQTTDLSDAQQYTVSDGKDISITEEGVYIISGSAEDVTITVEASEEDKIQIVLNNVSITNTDSPAIYVKSADKVFVTTAKNTENTLKVTDTFTADEETNTDAVIFSKDDLTLNGEGTLSISSTANAISSKDDLAVTGGTYKISCSADAFEAHDSIAVNDGTFDLTCRNGLKAEDEDDDTVGWICIEGGDFKIEAENDAIHGTTVTQIDGGTFDLDAVECIESTAIVINNGTVNITSSDDGMNASEKSSAYDVKVTINGGNITIQMGNGDTDGIDANGSIYVNGGTLNITANSPFDYDGEGQLNGGTVTINGEEVTALTNQFAGGGGMPGGSGMMGNGGPSGDRGGQGGPGSSAIQNL